MLNSGTTKLDQILNMRQSMSNRNGLGYTAIADSVATMSKTMFVKATPTTVNPYVSGENAKPSPPKHKVKKFVLIYHFYNMPSHKNQTNQP